MSDPGSHEAHDLPLASRLVDDLIGEWLATAWQIASCTADPKFSEYERGKSQGFDEMRWLHCR